MRSLLALRAARSASIHLVGPQRDRRMTRHNSSRTWPELLCGVVGLEIAEGL